MSEAKVILSAVDQTKAAFESANRNMASLGEKIGLVKAAMGGLLAGLSAGAFIGMIRGAIDSADHLNDLSKSTGIAVEQLAGLQLAAKQSGGDLDGIAASINKLSVAMGKDSDKFKALGITSKDPLEAFKQFADVFSAIQDPQMRAALGAEALGKSWASAAPLLAEGGQKIGEMVAKGTELSKTTKETAERADEFNDKMAELEAATLGAKVALAGEMLPALINVAKVITTAYEEAGKLQAIWVAFGALGAFMFTDEFSSATVKIKDLQFELKVLEEKKKNVAAGGLLDSIVFGSKNELAGKIQDVKEKIKALKDEMSKPALAASSKVDTAATAAAEAKAKKFLKPPKTGAPDHFADNFINQLITEYAALSGSMSKTEEVTRKLDTATEKFSVTERARALTMAGLIDKQKSMADAADNMARTTSAELEARQRLDDAHYASLETLEKLATDQNFELTLLGKLPEAIEKARFERDLDNQVRTANAALVARGLQYGWDEIRMEEERGKILRESTDARAAFGKIQADKIDQQYNPDRGVAEGIKSYMEEISKSGDTMKNSVTSAFKGMEDALVSFVKTGKLDFSSLADSVLSDMIRMQIQKSMMPAMSSMVAGGGSFIASLFGFANGGRPPVGVPSIVGERGPELFIPDAGGTIIPNHQLGGGGNSLVVNVIESPGNGGEQNRRSENGVDILDIMVEKIKGSIAGDISRGSGAVPAAMNRTYGLNRAVGAY